MLEFPRNWEHDEMKRVYWVPQRAHKDTRCKDKTLYGREVAVVTPPTQDTVILERAEARTLHS